MCRYSIDMGVSMCMPSTSTVVRDSDCLQLIKYQSTFEMIKPDLFKITKCRQRGDVGPTLKNEIFLSFRHGGSKHDSWFHFAISASPLVENTYPVFSHASASGWCKPSATSTHPADVSLSTTPHLQIAVQALLLTFLP